MIFWDDFINSHAFKKAIFTSKKIKFDLATFSFLDVVITIHASFVMTIIFVTVTNYIIYKNKIFSYRCI